MDKNEHFYLGTISKKFSFKGEVVLHLNADLNNFPNHIESVFIDIDHKRIPFFIENTKASKKNSIRIKFEDINSEEEANQLVKREVYIHKSEIEIDEEFSLKDLIGFEVFNENDEHLGEIVYINSSTPQDLFEIQSEKGIILIPVNYDWILEIDQDQNEIVLDLPEGLVDLNL